MGDDSTHAPGGDEAPPSEHWRISRRHFVAGGTAAATTLLIDANGVLHAAPADDFPISGRPVTGNNVAQWVRRRDDGLLLRFEFLNMRRAAGAPRVERRKAHLASHVVVVFPPQHIYEEAFFEPEANYDPSPGDEGVPSQPDPPNEEIPSPRPVGARLAGESRLAFELPAGIDSIELTAEALFDWVHWRMSVVPSAHAPATNARNEVYLRAPGDHETAIELPWWLILSPHRESVWAHVDEPVEHAGRTELWHTRLATRGPRRQQAVPDVVDEYWAADRSVRAVWARDQGMDLAALIRQHPTATPNIPPMPDGETFPEPGSPFRSSLTPRDRIDVVLSSADHVGHYGDENYRAPAIDVNRLMLTPMGAWIDSQGQWDPFMTGRSLEDWTQRGTHGRDNYVRIIRAGHLACFSHRCSLIKITERKFDESQDGPGSTAYLRQKLYVVRRQRFVDIGPGSNHPHDGREFPFTRVELVTPITPSLDPPEQFNSNFPQKNQLFIPKVNGEPFRFHVRLTDKRGRVHDHAMPLLFVDFDLSSDQSEMDQLIADFDAEFAPGPMQVVFSHDFKEKVALAAPATPDGDDTTVDVATMRWGMVKPDVVNPPAPYAPWFRPTMADVDLRFTAAEVASGGDLGTTKMVFDPVYLTSQWQGNDGGIFVTLENPGNPTPLGYGSGGNGDRVGGSFEPSIGISAVSRHNGVVSGSNPSTLHDGTFDPADFFGLAGAKLLGGITLADVISALVTDLDDAPKLRHRELDNGGEPYASEVRLDWESWLQSVSVGPATNLFEPHGDQGTTSRPPDLILHSETIAHFTDPSKSRSKVVGELKGFTVNLFGTGPAGFIGVDFNYLRFTSIDGAKPAIDVDLAEVTFREPLKFIDKLDPYLQSAGLGGLFIDLTPTGVTAGYSIGLPAVEIGAFSLQNIAIYAGVTIPFTGQPVRLRFAFCSRENPFILTIMCFGGGGFVGLGIGADGVELVEAALEARAQVGLNIAVASGSVSAALGIYFRYEIKPNPNGNGTVEVVELTGYLRLQGKVRVMGIVSVSVEFYLAFTYQPGPNKVTGQASLTIEIDVLLFSGSVTMKVERRFGGENDPTFGEMYAPNDWNDYVAAFAA